MRTPAAAGHCFHGPRFADGQDAEPQGKDKAASEVYCMCTKWYLNIKKKYEFYEAQFGQDEQRRRTTRAPSLVDIPGV